MKDSYRILRVIHSLRRETGGPVAGLAETTPILTEAGIVSEFAVLDGVTPQDAPFCGYPLHVFKARNGYGSCPQFKAWLNDHIQNYDAVFVHGCWKYHGVAVRDAALKHGVPYLLYPHGMLDPWFNKAYPLKWLKKQVYWWLREYAVIRDAKAVLFTSQEEMRLAATAFKPYRANGRVMPYGTRAPNPSDVDNGLRFRASLGFATNTPYILYFGRIHEKKGIDMLIDAWKEWKASVSGPAADWRLVIAGPTGDPQHESLLATKMAERPDIHRTGGLFGVDKWSALSGALAMVLPSHQENFGMVVAESLSVGTPVLITKQVNIWREVVEAGAGIAKVDTQDGLTRMLCEFDRTHLNLEAYKQLQTNALTCYCNFYCIDNLGSVMKSLLAPIQR